MKRRLAVMIALAVLCVSAVADDRPPKGKGPSRNPPKLANAQSSSYVACYFGNSWEWGTQANGSYYSTSGDYKDSKAGTIFTTSTDIGAILEACDNVKRQKGISNAFSGAYAATRNLGNNYAIVNVRLVP
jgi:hypothetical protein